MKKTMSKKILSPLRRDGYKAGMIMMLIALSTMLLTTACSSEDDLVNNTANTENTINKGYALPVTVNATRQGDATRATFDGSKLNFSAGDKLFVYGSATAAGSFAGELTWQSGGTFSGTIYTESPYEGTANDLFAAASAGSSPECYLTATLLPNGYDANGSNSFLSIDNKNTTEAYDDRLSVDFSDAFVASETAKATGVEQLSWERTTSYSSVNGFALSPGNAILNFTISGLAAGAQDVSLQIDNGIVYTVTGSVTPTSGVATFAIGVPVGAKISSEENNLTVGSSNLTLPSSTTFAAGHIYNIARNVIPGALIGVFSVGDTKKVYFSKGNLQYDGTNWKFADSQWEVLGANGTGANGTATNYPMDLFTWGNIDSPTYNGTTYYTENADLSGITDWGSRMGSGWCTLTKAEWSYLFYTRTVNGDRGADYSFTLGQSVNGKLGVVLYPDDYTGAAYTTGSNWSTFESAGCVFLPAAGYRGWGTDVDEVGTDGYYWSSTAYGDEDARYVYFDSEDLNVDDYTTSRNCGHSVRLVRPVQ